MRAAASEDDELEVTEERLEEGSALVGACEGTYIWLLTRESPIKKLK